MNEPETCHNCGANLDGICAYTEKPFVEVEKCEHWFEENNFSRHFKKLKEQAADPENIRRSELEHKNRAEKEISDRIHRSGIPHTFKKRADWTVNPGAEIMISFADDYCKVIGSKVRDGIGMIILGRIPGTGKSTVAAHIGLTAALNWCEVRWISEIRVAYMLSSQSYRDADERDELVSECERCDLLIWDDLLMGEFSAMGQALRMQIFDYRATRKKAVVFTSNVESVADLQKELGERLLSRIIGIVGDNIVVCKATKDMRLPA